jgi:hypothetical protein
MKLHVIKVVRRCKHNSRVQLSNGKFLVVENNPPPYKGMRLDVEGGEEDSLAEIRPLRAGDPLPELVSSMLFS